MKTIFVLIDALKSSYLNEKNLPFLWSLTQKNKYCINVVPGPGFCERSEIFSGLDSFDSGFFTAIGYDPSNSAFRGHSFLPFRIIALFSKRLSGALFWRYTKLKKIRMLPYAIPYSILNKFSLTEDGEKIYVNHADLFDVLKRSNKSYSLSCFTSLASETPSINQIVSKVEKEIESGTYFIPSYIGTIDEKGHEYGNDIESLRVHLLQVDSVLKQLYELAKDSGYSICFLGDHGMIPVTKYVDIISPLKRLGLKLNKDYCFFLDSTIARFWFFNDISKKKITDMLYSLFVNDGIIVDSSNYKEHRIPLDVKNVDGQPLYGDILWFANKGVLISPDFFHHSNSTEKGMHGYLDQHFGDGTGLFISVSPLTPNETIESIYLKDICKELCNILEIEQPNKEWKREVVK